MITAQEAVDLMPTTGVATVLEFIENAVRDAAKSGLRSCMVHNFIPNWTKWVIGAETTQHKEIQRRLVEAGYQITTEAGDNTARGFIQIAWA